jgi:nucleoid-associated protein YgaU
MLQDKYRSVLDLGEKLEVADGYVNEEEGVLKIGGTAKTQYHKNLMWDKIKEIGGEQPADLVADIKVAETAFYHKHTVEKGDTLGKIAKKYYGDPMKYKEIFEANTDKLKNPDLIYPGQELTLPFV